MSHASESRQGTPYDTLEIERQRFSSVQGVLPTSSQSSKEAMQQLYKQQLDTFLQEKSKQKQLQRMRQQQQKKEFNQRAQQGKQAELMKQISYKNYYNMLMNNQNYNQETYVSPFAKRDNLKDNLINKAIEDERSRYQNVQMEIRKRQAQKRNSYRNDLLQQIEERKRIECAKKQNEIKQKQHYQSNSKVPVEIMRYEKEKHKDEVAKYRENLDMMLEGKDRYQSDKGVSLAAMRPEFHNVLTNPLPYNIQNPYILKEMTGLRNPSSYLAMKGSQNLKLG